MSTMNLAARMPRYLVFGTVAVGTAASLAALHQASAEWLTALIVFGAAVISSIVGFAFSAISAPLILQRVPDAVEAVQIMMIASIGIQTYSVVQLRRSIEWSRCVPFIAGGLAALPFGVALLLAIDPHSYIRALGAALIVYGGYMFFRRTPAAHAGKRTVADTLVGAIGGITGPIAAFPAAFVTIWCARRGWTKLEQRAVYQPYTLVMQVIGTIVLAVVQPRGAFDPALLGYALPALAGAVIGLRLFRSLGDGQFQRLVNVALVASGAALVLK